MKRILTQILFFFNFIYVFQSGFRSGTGKFIASTDLTSQSGKFIESTDPTSQSGKLVSSTDPTSQ
jgi:hypothetical protein